MSAFVRLPSLAVPLLALGCATADIRPDVIKEGTSESLTNEDGAVWLKRAAAAQGGRAAFLAAKTASLVLTDDWPGWLMRTAGSPWEHNPQKMRLDAALGTDDGRLTLLDGPAKGTAWGIQNWVTYRVDAQGKVTFDPADAPNEDIKFWVPTVQYFPFLVFRILEADVVRYAGDEVIDGRGYARVYATWGRAEPQEDVDQYVLWIDRETNLVRWVQYTVRDYAGWMVGTMRYADYRAAGDLKLPFEIYTVDGAGGPGPQSHGFEIEEAKVGVAFPDGYLAPQPDLTATK